MMPDSKTVNDLWEAINSIRGDVRALAVSMAEAQGEAKGIKWLAGIVVTVSGFIVAFISLWR
jgi:hypothetical protein